MYTRYAVYMTVMQSAVLLTIIGSQHSIVKIVHTAARQYYHYQYVCCIYDDVVVVLIGSTQTLHRTCVVTIYAAVTTLPMAAIIDDSAAILFLQFTTLLYYCSMYFSTVVLYMQQYDALCFYDSPSLLHIRAGQQYIVHSIDCNSYSCSTIGTNYYCRIAIAIAQYYYYSILAITPINSILGILAMILLALNHPCYLLVRCVVRRMRRTVVGRWAGPVFFVPRTRLEPSLSHQPGVPAACQQSSYGRTRRCSIIYCSLQG